MGIEIAVAGLLALAAVLLFVYSGVFESAAAAEASQIFPGFLRGCAVVLVAVVVWLLHDPVTMADPNRDVMGLAILATIGISIVFGWWFRRAYLRSDPPDMDSPARPVE